MPEIHVVMGEHFSVPGLRTSAHRTIEGANAMAAELVNIMLKDRGMSPPTDANEWQQALDDLQDAVGAAHCDVSIITTTVLD